MDTDRVEARLVTFAHICVEADLSLGLPDKMTFIWNNSKWIVKLYYENTTFKCHICRQIGHLQ